jgi:hypothetical protein
MLISESDDGRATARARQNVGRVLKAVKNSGEVRRIIVGGTNLPESTSCADITVVFSNRSARRSEQDCARDWSGARQQSPSANSSELVKNLLCLLGIVADYRQLDEIVGDPGCVNSLEVDARLAEPARDIGEHTGLVLE